MRCKRPVPSPPDDDATLGTLEHDRRVGASLELGEPDHVLSGCRSGRGHQDGETGGYVDVKSRAMEERCGALTGNARKRREEPGSRKVRFGNAFGSLLSAVTSITPRCSASTTYSQSSARRE